MKSGGLERSWEKQKSQSGPCPKTDGLIIKLEHKSISGDIAEVAEFFALTFAWTPYPWTFNELPMTTSVSTPKSVMMFNAPDLATSVIPGVAIHSKETQLQLFCQWSTPGQTVVVIHGVAYPLQKPLLKGMKCAIFSDPVQRNLTKTEVVVSNDQRTLWSSALSELVKVFVGKKHLWNSKDFLTRNGPVFCRALWRDFENPGCLFAAQRLATVCSKETFSSFIMARAAILKEDHLGALYHCLLYTSPSPRDLSTSRMPSSA